MLRATVNPLRPSSLFPSCPSCLPRPSPRLTYSPSPILPPPSPFLPPPSSLPPSSLPPSLLLPNPLATLRDLSLELALQKPLELKQEDWDYCSLDFVMALPSKVAADNKLKMENEEKANKEKDDIIAVFKAKAEKDASEWLAYLEAATSENKNLDEQKRAYKQTQRGMAKQAAEKCLSQIVEIKDDPMEVDSMIACIGQQQRQAMMTYPQFKHPVTVILVDGNMMDTYTTDLTNSLFMAKASPLNTVVVALMPYSAANQETKCVQPMPWRTPEAAIVEDLCKARAAFKLHMQLRSTHCPSLVANF